MGGVGSGLQRSRTRRVERCHRLDMALLRRSGCLLMGRQTISQIAWGSSDSEAQGLSITVQLDLFPEYTCYRITRAEDHHENETQQLIGTGSLIRTNPAYGGVRWWFGCPWCGRRVRILYSLLVHQALPAASATIFSTPHSEKLETIGSGGRQSSCGLELGVAMGKSHPKSPDVCTGKPSGGS